MPVALQENKSLGSASNRARMAKSSTSPPGVRYLKGNKFGLSTAFANTLTDFFSKDFSIDTPGVTETLTRTICHRQLLQKFSTSSLTTITDHKRYDLASATVHYTPKPAFSYFLRDKRLHFIRFKDVIRTDSHLALGVLWLF